MNRLKTMALIAQYMVEVLRAYARLFIRLWRGDVWLPFHFWLFLHTLLDKVTAAEVVFEMCSKQPGPGRGLRGLTRWKPSTRNHPAFENSDICEFTFTVIRPGESQKARLRMGARSAQQLTPEDRKGTGMCCTALPMKYQVQLQIE